MLGLEGEIYAWISFLDDARGGRNTCALEAADWTSPPLKPDHDTDPARPEIRSAIFSVNDLDRCVTGLSDASCRVGDAVAGQNSGSRSVLLMDPDGLGIELTEMSSERWRRWDAVRCGAPGIARGSAPMQSARGAAPRYREALTAARRQQQGPKSPRVVGRQYGEGAVAAAGLCRKARRSSRVPPAGHQDRGGLRGVHALTRRRYVRVRRVAAVKALPRAVGRCEPYHQGQRQFGSGRPISEKGTAG